MSNADWMQRDLRHVWHPCTQMKDHEQLPLVPIRRGQGLWLEDFDGKRYLDGISSWWVNLFGHANPELNAALSQQADTLEHVILAGFTHQAIIELSERLVALAPPGLEKCFYADNGSSGIEVALKMSLHAWRNLNKPEKTRFIALENSYHGETIGALGVTDIPLFSETYKPMLQAPLRAPSPDASLRREGETCADVARRAMAGMEQLLQDHAHEVAAVIVEPLIQGAAGMRMYNPIYLTLLREACDRHGVHLIADEIAVGFGRTGTFFACEQANISPDFLVLSKGLTAGYLPMSVVMTSNVIYDIFYDRYETLRGFLHSHSYTGNALAARVALASLDIFARDDVIVANQARSLAMAQALAPLHDHPHIHHIRQTGMVAAFDLVRDKANGTPYDWRERRGLAVFQAALKRGLLLRPIGNVVYFMPPYIITAEQIRWMVATAVEAINEALAAPASDSAELGPSIA
ncbi:MAG: adenosylmethionine--8-amino-7-oxononanoate transaminase [Moraxellaceae bacterium]|nr:adenosylmethionine--8-amino-7-oxononanoate transaminase [Moraxellaceae bacterium]MDP1775483.1 adenosylmethionine--8-amino-7-oxononanoate transaminase [Moraxellaceae bacterium]